MKDEGDDSSGIGMAAGEEIDGETGPSVGGEPDATAADGSGAAADGRPGAATSAGSGVGAGGGSGAVTDESIGVIAFLTRSPVRVRVLHALHRNGPVEKRELRDLVDGVRTTVTRNLTALEDRGWIEDTPEGYEITGCGRMIVEELVALTESASLAVDLRPALRWLNVERLDLDLRHFERANITAAASTNPYAPIEEQVALVRRATAVRAALPTVNRQILEASRRTARSDGGDVTLVVEAEAITELRGRYPELFADVCRECAVLEYEGTLPYYLGVDGDDGVQLGTTDDDNLIRVLLRFEPDDGVRSWATDRFERFERDAHPVEKPG
ncbi:ArsR family transcriptional regulator [Halorubrum sp. BOL3-1]|uniref:helix-turn-helix transcriptional regulator n=1 Tax=Halorubrum sp. BOL3-1 TaxID=2497325 RepID=UPI00100521A1|nr:helix-turn-helix domain-containing protein [Halorubrum sp. BOL3-1]QAU13584.1 ArsR family transcriptional regulator [Halorubrum sp. BOL3-1]